MSNSSNRLQKIPINEKKVPLVKNWQNSTESHDLSSGYGVGLVCGNISGGVEAIDFDLKYSLNGFELFDEYKSAVEKAKPGLLRKMTVQKTVSGGYHLIYRCAFDVVVEGNQKLAQRYATPEESEKGERIKVLIETRGEKGYIAIPPTPGYMVVYGDIENLNEITGEERDVLLETARSFNQVVKEVFKPSIITNTNDRASNASQNEITPFDDYDNRGDVIALLIKHGWSVVGTRGEKILVKRPGDTNYGHSGNYDRERNWFSVFTTSTQFDAEKAYRPYAVYAILECNGDFNEAVRRLSAEGYGTKTVAHNVNNYNEDFGPSSKTSSSRIHVIENFVASRDEYLGYIEKVKSGTLEMGLKTGIPTLDTYFRFKRGNLVMGNGHDNVGKSQVAWYLMMLSAMYHGWRWIVLTSENSPGSFFRRMMEYFWCERISDMSRARYDYAVDFIERHFTIIRSDEEMYNYRDVLSMAKALNGSDSYGAYDGLLIDPYNGLKVDLSSKSKLSTHEYHYEALSEIKLFGRSNRLSVWIMAHAVTEALRIRRKDGFLEAPRKADTEGGGKSANKADEFITFHRLVDHPHAWNETELHIRKVKETETGGKVTPLEEPVKLKSISGLLGFEDISTGLNAVMDYHAKNPIEGVTHVRPMKMAPNLLDFENENEFP